MIGVVVAWQPHLMRLCIYRLRKRFG